MRLRSLDEIQALPPLQWQLEGLLPVGCCFLVGAPNTGKSSIAIDIAARAYYGLPWVDGRHLRAASVLYCASEGIAGVAQRARAFQRTHAPDGTPGRYFVIADQAPPLSTHAGREALVAAVESLREQHGHPPGLLVIDTLSGHWGADEDRADLVGGVMAFLQGIAEKCGLCILLIHHVRKPGKGEGKQEGGDWASLRGSGAWAASADAIVSASGPPDSIVLTITKQRDAERSAPIRVRLLPVELEPGPDGSRRTATVVAPADQGVSPKDPFEESVDSAVAALHALGGIATKSAIRARMKGRTETRVGAIDAAVQRGRMVPDRSQGRAVFRLSSVPCSPP